VSVPAVSQAPSGAGEAGGLESRVGHRRQSGTARQKGIPHGKVFDVTVVGGGLAGLSRARQLRAAGASVVVLEGRSRVCGRVHSQRLETGHTIDLGAQFIGDAQRRISALVDEVGLTRVSPYAAGDHVFVLSPDAEPLFRRGEGLPLSLFGQLDALAATWGIDRRLRSFRDDVERARLIRAAQGLGFTLAEIGELASAYAAGALRREESVQVLRAHLAALNERAVHLDALRRHRSDKLEWVGAGERGVPPTIPMELRDSAAPAPGTAATPAPEDGARTS
jgi:phytoene dehydrogenase-like protein